MENLKIKSNEFRIRKMNAIEVISFRSLMDFKTLDGVSSFFKTVLENIEVKIGDEWLPVKEKNREVYYPNGIENDIISSTLKYSSMHNQLGGLESIKKIWYYLKMKK